MRLPQGFAIATIVIVLAGCSNGSSSHADGARTAEQAGTPATSSATSDDQAPIVLESTADWPIYDSQPALTKASSTVVVGRVVSLGAPRTLETSQANLPANKRNVPGPIVTDVTVSVERVLRGAPGLRGSEITVQQVGGTIGRYTSRLAGDPLARVRDRYVLFLVAAPAGSGVSHVIVGGPQGRYVVARDNTLRPVEGTAADGTGAQRQIAGKTVATLGRAVAST